MSTPHKYLPNKVINRLKSTKPTDLKEEQVDALISILVLGSRIYDCYDLAYEENKSESRLLPGYSSKPEYAAMIYNHIQKNWDSDRLHVFTKLLNEKQEAIILFCNSVKRDLAIRVIESSRPRCVCLSILEVLYTENKFKLLEEETRN